MQSLVGWRPSQLGWRPSLVGWRPFVLDEFGGCFWLSRSSSFHDPGGKKTRQMKTTMLASKVSDLCIAEGIDRKDWLVTAKPRHGMNLGVGSMNQYWLLGVGD